MILVILGVITAGLGYQIKDVHIAFGLPRLLPDDDPNWEIYQEFKDRFKSESTVFVIGLEEDPLENMTLFNAWYDLGKRISSIDGVDTVLSVASVFNVYKDTAEKRFAVPPIVSQPVQSEAELDSIRGVLYSLPFYRGLLYNDTNSVNLMGVSLNNERFNSENRGPMLDLIVEEVESFQKAQNIQVRLSGLPYIRTVITSLIKSELNQFIAMAVGVTVLILFFFFRSIKPVLVSMLVVGLGVVWSMGTMGLFNYEISILTSIIPPLIIVIGIPNCIFLINKYHSEYRMHGNQAKALTRVVQKIGKATFLTNVTTATGFLTFIFTQSDMLVEFGIIASLNIFLLFVLSLLIITIVFSYLSAPKPRHTQHLETRWVRRVVDALNGAVDNHRKWVYV
ncbi:MAG: MMPL family transporter, partial [Bacteroidota bacterium]